MTERPFLRGLATAYKRARAPVTRACIIHADTRRATRVIRPALGPGRMDSSAAFTHLLFAASPEPDPA